MTILPPSRLRPAEVSSRSIEPVDVLWKATVPTLGAIWRHQAAALMIARFEDHPRQPGCHRYTNTASDDGSFVHLKV